VEGNSLYTVTPGIQQGSYSTIDRSQLDGSNSSVIVNNTFRVCGVDVFNGYVYWVVQFDYKSEIWRAPLDQGWRSEKVIEVSQRHVCGLEVTAGTGAGDGIRAGKPQLRDDGTAMLPVHTSGAGPVKLSGRGLRTVRTQVRRARRILLPVHTKGFKARRLERNGEVDVTAKVVSTPPDGKRQTDRARIHLRLR
jgi:hypothetical protein